MVKLPSPIRFGIAPRRAAGRIGILVALTLAIVVSGLGLVERAAARQQTSPLDDPSSFSATIDNPMFPLSRFGYREYKGYSYDLTTGELIETRVEETLLPETREVARVDVAVIEVREYEDGELVELTLDFFTQHADGTVYYMGEEVSDYEDGDVTGHSGEWLAGEGENQPGVSMPARAELGQTYQQEIAPGVAEDYTTVVALDQPIATVAGTFSGCMRTEDVNPLDDSTEYKYYCPEVGFVREESGAKFLDLVRYDPVPAATPVT
jgi:hypothetical protein